MSTEEQHDRRPVLVAHAISKFYGPITALDQVNLEIYPGEIVAIGRRQWTAG